MAKIADRKMQMGSKIDPARWPLRQERASKQWVTVNCVLTASE